MKNICFPFSPHLLFSSKELAGMKIILRRNPSNLPSSLQKGDWVLLYDSIFKDFPEKLQTRWLGPYKIKEVHDNGTVTLATIDRFGSRFLVNGHWLRLYHQLLSKESFCQEVSNDPTV
jgi:hypothetical protein